MDPISRAQQEAASIASTEADETARNFAIRDKPIPEDESEAQRAMSSMANQLRLQAQSLGANRAVGSVRGRRDVRNTMFIPAGVDLASAGATSPSSPPQQSQSQPITGPYPSASEFVSPIARPVAQPRTIHEDHALSDTHSIHSSHSLTIQPHHPELHSPGLNASIVETVNTWFSESAITKSFVTGEIALAYNSIANMAPSEAETVRVRAFEVLEKVAANPMFVFPSKASSGGGGVGGEEEQAGTYAVNLGSIRKSTPSVALKYQLHIAEEELGRYSPVLLSVAWQVVEGQTSVILLYSLNPAFSANADGSGADADDNVGGDGKIDANGELTLKNAVISVALDPASEVKAASAMMSPTQNATFRKRMGTGAVMWRIAELTIRGKQERMLVRFMTPGGTARKGTVEVKFEIAGRGASVVGVERKVADGGREVDPFSDEDGGRGSGDGPERGWEDVTTTRMLVSGRYCAS